MTFLLPAAQLAFATTRNTSVSQGQSAFGEGSEVWLVGKIMTQNRLEIFPNPLSLFNMFIFLY